MICCLFALFAAVSGVIVPASRLCGCHRGRRLVVWGAVAGMVVVLGAASAWAWAGSGMPDTPICRFLGHTARLTLAQEGPR
jgi:hypothetical protein